MKCIIPRAGYDKDLWKAFLERIGYPWERAVAVWTAESERVSQIPDFLCRLDPYA